MKFTLLFLLLAVMQGYGKAYSQGAKLSVEFQNMRLSKALEAIAKKTDYHFLYNEKEVKSSQKINLTASNEPVTGILERMLQPSGLSFKVLANNLVVIAPQPENIIIQKITGKVTDSTGQPLVGVTIRVQGGSTGTVTDAEGNFALDVPDNAVLEISYIGYDSKTVNVNGQSNLNIILQLSNSSLNEVVVIGYGTQKKRDLTGSITSVSGDDIANLPSTNPVASLQGKVAGLTIVNSGRAGSSPTVRIRGVNSTNNSDPLYVVDGVFETNIDYLNPADIESIEVLRDPSSTAIFGMQGGSGVIIVTTKRAKKGETRISFQSSVGVQKVNHTISVTDAAGFKKLYDIQLKNIGASPFDYTNYTGNTNWQNLILRDAIINSNNLSVSTSGEKSTTLFNLGYNNQQGVLKFDHYEKYIGRLNQEIRFNDHIKIGGDVTGFYWKQQTPEADLNNALWAAPIVPVQAGDGLYYSMPSFQRAQVGNPMARLNQNTGNSLNKGYRVLGSIYAEIKFLQHFTFKSSFYTDLAFNNSRTYSPLPYRYINLGEGAAKTDTTFDESVHTSVGQKQQEFRKFQQDHVLTYDNTFNEKHHLTVTAGFTTLYSGNSQVSGNRRDTVLNIPRDPDLWYLNVVNLQNSVLSNDGQGGEEAYMSFLGRVNYAYAGKYLANVTFRRDGSSKFSPSNRWGNFGSVGLGWVISSENFFRNVKGIDFLKIRGAWGTLGNALGTGDNLYLPVVTTANVGVFGDNVYSSVTPAYVPSPNLHWEVVRGIDLGLEVRALQSRLSADVTLYDRTTKDILTTVTLPGTAGDYNYFTNLGDISNRGIEVALGWNDKIGSELTYGISANFSYNKNKVVSIGNDINFQILGNGGVNVTETGKSIGYFYGYRQIGIYQTTAELDKAPRLSNSLPGDIAYEDINGDGVITDKDRTYLGTPFPPYNFGFNIQLGYKGFDFIFEGQGVAGNKIYTQRRTATFATLNYETNRLNAWTAPGTTNIEPILDNTRGNNYLFSTYYLEPGDYFRIQTIQLGYNFTGRIIKNSLIKQLRVYINGQNLATFSQVTGYTPEVSLASPISSGADNGTYPVPAVYSFGINLTF